MKISSIHDIKNDKVIFGVLGFITGLSITAIIYKLFLQFPLMSKRNLAIGFLILIITTPIVFFILNRFFAQAFIFHNGQTRLLILAGIIAFSAWLYFNFSLDEKPIHLLLPDHSLEITLPLGSMPENQDVTLTWFNVGLRDVSFSELEIEGVFFEENDGLHFPSGQTVNINWKGKIGDSTTISFQSPQSPCEVLIEWDGNQESILLNTDTGSIAYSKKIELPSLYVLIDFILIIPGIFFAVFLMALSISSR